MAETNESPDSPASRNEGEHNANTEPPQDVQQAEETTKDTRMWAMFCHLAGLAGLVVPIILSGIIAPLVIWQIKKDEHPFIDQHGKEAVNFQISIAIYSLVSGILILAFCIGAFLLGAVAIFDVVFLLIAAVKANNGYHYRYPLTIRFIK